MLDLEIASLVARLMKKYSNISFDKIDDFWKPQNLKKQIMLILSSDGLMKNYSKTSCDNSWKLHCMKILKIQKWYHNCVLWTNIADGIFWGIWTSCRLVSICGKRIKSSCYRMCYFKVVIPSTSYGKKNVFFDPSWWSFHFWTWYLGEGTWDRYSQAPKMHLVISNTCSQHALTTVIQKAKIHLLKQFWTQK